MQTRYNFVTVGQNKGGGVPGFEASLTLWPNHVNNVMHTGPKILLPMS